MFSYQNCAPGVGDGFLIDQSSFSAQEIPVDTGGGSLGTTGDLCEDELLKTFGAGYYPFLQKNCAGCHNGSHEAPAFASSSGLTSYQVFQDKGFQVVGANAVSTTHNPPFTGPKHATKISELSSVFEAALTTYQSCKGGPAPVSNHVVTTSKANASIYNNRTTTNWYPLAWNLSTDISEGKKYPIQMTVEAQIAKSGTVQVGYAFRNLTARGSGSQKFRVRGVFFHFNTVLQENVTIYRSADVIICPNQSFNFQAGNNPLLVASRRAATDRFALEFESIEVAPQSATCGAATGGGDDPVDMTPATVTYAQLVSNDPQLGVFRRNCFACHSGARRDAGLDLSNYTQARARASTIAARIADSGSPMPTSGLMPSSLQALVNRWVQNGAPP